MSDFFEMMLAENTAQGLPVVLVPGLTCTGRLFREQIPPLWQFGRVTIADHRRDDSVQKIAERILATAPPRFALAVLSMGGFIAFEIMRQAPNRIAKLALLDTSARPGTPEQSERRLALMRLSSEGRFAQIPELGLSSVCASEPASRRGPEGGGAHDGPRLA